MWTLPQLVSRSEFDGVKDYDNYIARLKKVPTAFSQIRTNMELGMEAGRMPPAVPDGEGLAQAQALADQKPADSPFALPLKKFPKTVSAAEQKRITTELLDAITDRCAAGVQAVRDVHAGAVYSEGPQGAGRLGAAGWRCLLRLPDSAEHDAE